MNRLFCLVLILSAIAGATPSAFAQDASPTVAERIDNAMEPVANLALEVVFFSIPIGNGLSLPIVLILLGGTAVFLTLYFKFINVRAFGIAWRTIRGKYTDPNAPGQITHFQALSAALSATVGLGNIAGVAVAIGIGGPGAIFWMILMGLFGMTTKFTECTLGVKFRRIDHFGKVHGGAMYYLRDGLRHRGLAPVGLVLAFLFALFVIGGAFGAGNMFQANQAFSQFNTTWPDALTFGNGALSPQLVFGVTLAILVGLVILGGIVWIARVTALLVPFMCGIYVIAALVIIFGNIGEVGPAFSTIVQSAFSGEAAVGGFIGGLIQGIRRAAFSNEAGLGSAPIAHSAVKTDKPASEGFVALLEPFVDTVVVCTMTALVIVITGTWRVSGEIDQPGAQLVVAPQSTEVVQPLDPGQYIHTRDSRDGFVEVIGLISSEDRSVTEVEGWVDESVVANKRGVPVTSMAFGTRISWFPQLLAVAVLLFAFSTMISWSYYGEQGVNYLFSFLGEDLVRIPVAIYKVVFCLLIIVGSSATLGNVLNLSDAMVFAMVVPNLIGLYLLLPVVRKEARSFLDHVKTVDGNKG